MWIAKLKRKLAKYIHLIKFALRFAVPLIVFVVIIKLSWPYLVLIKQAISGPVNVVSVILPKETTLLSDQQRTNVLLLGIGGGKHDGPDLTDSMMVVSINSNLQRNTSPPVVLISIPRDIYLDSISAKVNSAYSIGNEKKPGSGFVLAKSVVSQITGLPIHYAFLIDFSGFEKAIDLLGGIDVSIQERLDDPQYPIPGKENDLCGLEPNLSEEEYTCRFEHLVFEPGLTHLDGSQTLKFVRSRHAVGEQGTDFARARRQQTVIQAIKNKLFSSQTLLNPTGLSNIYKTFESNINTDISPDEMAIFLKIVIKDKGAKISSLVLDDQFFDNPPIDYRGWILVPRGGNFDQIHNQVNSFLKQADSSAQK